MLHQLTFHDWFGYRSTNGRLGNKPGKRCALSRRVPSREVARFVALVKPVDNRRVPSVTLKVYLVFSSSVSCVSLLREESSCAVSVCVFISFMIHVPCLMIHDFYRTVSYLRSMIFNANNNPPSGATKYLSSGCPRVGAKLLPL